ncbi:phage head closure protein [Amorphus orientalis]|uniref:SPP1 family predicted phage head-tail adaptor n=1 Tax=Amorphus orientalis TaxID=649198 RepID=A0AAE4AUV9_9HYPH|nr:phage head closure protein [Amorphus orientalis]MDQ0317835.1 SPP1 family predicted phage head-tail adaptor [Amorphus orientalis]
MSANVPIGALDRRIVIEAPTSTPDGAGGVTVTWTPLATVWARVETLSAAERVRAGRPDGIATHRVTIRALSGIASGQRILVDGRVLTVRATRPSGDRDAYLVLEAEEEGR